MHVLEHMYFANVQHKISILYTYLIKSRIKLIFVFLYVLNREISDKQFVLFILS